MAFDMLSRVMGGDVGVKKLRQGRKSYHIGHRLSQRREQGTERKGTAERGQRVRDSGLGDSDLGREKDI